MSPGLDPSQPSLGPGRALTCPPLRFISLLPLARSLRGRTCQLIAASSSGYKPKTDYPKSGAHLRFPTKRQQVEKLQEGVAFSSGSKYNLEEYQKYAEDFRTAYLEENGIDPSAFETQADLETRMEKEFWRIVETGAKQVTVDYANDLNSSKYGSGFEHDTSCAWDLTKLHLSPFSLLKEIQCEIQGVTKPWMYLGSLFTSFCWHTEDHYLYSINYMHKGHGKTWYGIPSTSANKFEAAMKTFMPERFKQNPDLMYRLITLLSPSYCLGQGVDVRHTVQREGEFVITFPNAYHGGFSHGLNCAEAVNFALPQWLSFGAQAMEKYHKVGRKGGKRDDVFAHDQLLYHLGKKLSEIVLENKSKLASAQGGAGSAQDKQDKLNACIRGVVINNLPYDAKVFVRRLLQGFKKSTKTELHLRKWLNQKANMRLNEKVSYPNAKPPQCWVCKCMPYFSHVQCKNHPERIACPSHAFVQCDCKGDCKGLAVVVTEKGIKSMENFISSIDKCLSVPLPGNGAK